MFASPQHIPSKPKPATQPTSPVSGTAPVLGEGRSLDGSVRAWAEAGLQAPLGHLRVHEGGAADAAVRGQGALGWSWGHHIALRDLQGPKRDLVLLHEVAHSVQQRGATAATSAPAATGDSRATERDAARSAFGLWARGSPEARAVPRPRLLARAGDYGIARAEAESALDDPRPRLLAPLRLHRCDGEPLEEQTASEPETSAPTQLPPGTPAGPTGPQVSLPGAGVAAEPDRDLTGLQAELRLLTAGLDRLATSAGKDKAFLGSIEKARKELGSVQTGLVGGAADNKRVQLAVAIVERLETVLPLLNAQAGSLKGRTEHLAALDQVRSAYRQALDHLFAADAQAVFNAAEEAARRLPRALVDVELSRIEKHAQLNHELLIPAEKLLKWVPEMRRRLDAFEAMTPASTSTAKLVAEGEFLQFGLEGMDQFDRQLRAFEAMLRNRPGVLDTPIIDAMNRLNARVEAIRTAFYAGDLADLKTRVTSLRNDPAVPQFYSALPAMMGVTTLIAQIGITYVAAAMSGGVGGLVGGGVRAATTGLTARAALSFAGTIALEALTFTAVSTTLNAVLLGHQPTFGSVLRDLAWNAGLFLVLRVAGAGVTRGLRAADLEILAGPVNLVTPFPLLQGYGILRFRLEQGRWPTSAEMSRMTAENLLMMAALAVGLRAVQRWMGGRPDSALQKFRDSYGVGFEGLRAVRSRLEAELQALEQKGAPDAEIEVVRRKLTTLETEFQELLRKAVADRRFTVDQIRTELEALRDVVPEGSAELLSRTLNLPPDVELQRAGSRSHTFAWGKTGAVEKGLRDAGATVTKSQDPVTGLRQVEATFGADKPVTFQERARSEIPIAADAFEVQKLFTELSVTRPEAQRMLLRLMSEHLLREPSRDYQWAVKEARREVQQLLKRPGAPTSAETLLLDLQAAGRLRTTADAALVAQAGTLEAAGILKSPEWLDSRSDAQFEGVVTEWLARGQVTLPPGGRVIRQIRFIGDGFADAAGKTPYVRKSGQALTNTDLAELDYAGVVDRGAAVEVHSVANVKAGKKEAAAAAAQNANALSLIRGSTSGLVPVTLDGKPAFARVTRVVGKDGTAEVDLTGRLREAAGGAAEQTVGPSGGKGYTNQIPVGRTQIRDLAKLLVERQLVVSKTY